MKRRRRKRHCRFRRKRRRCRRNRCKTIVKIRIKRLCRSRNGRRWSPIVAAAVLSGTPASDVAKDVVRQLVEGEIPPTPGRGGGGGRPGPR